MKAARTKKCRVCTTEFQPFQTTAFVCGPKCAMAWAAKQSEKKQAAAEKHQRKLDREAKERLKSVRKLLSEAQVEFNKFIRLRDRELPCVSCGRMHLGQWHASHFRSVGACSSLRFDEDNVHKSCSPCNSHLSGNLIEYEIRLREKIGPDRVERLKMAPRSRRWTKEEAREVKRKYREKWRELEREIANEMQS